MLLMAGCAGLSEIAGCFKVVLAYQKLRENGVLSTRCFGRCKSVNLLS